MFQGLAGRRYQETLVEAAGAFGAGALLFGTDEPHVPDASRDVLTALRARPWPSFEVENVVSGNARRLGVSGSRNED